MYTLLHESWRTDAGKCANSINALTTGLTTRALTIVDVFFTVFPTKAIRTLTEVRDGAGGHLKVDMTRFNACGIVLTLVVLTLVDINFAVLPGEPLITDTGIGLWTVLEAGAMVQAGLKMARVMRDVTDRTTPTSTALALEANVHC